MSIKMSRTRGDNVSAWDTAIRDAEKKIGEAQVGIERLGRAIKIFTELRDAGEPWPGTSESDGGAYGSTSTFRAKPSPRILSNHWIPEYQITCLAVECESRHS
jgi:hypothetical protein